MGLCLGVGAVAKVGIVHLLAESLLQLELLLHALLALLRHVRTVALCLRADCHPLAGAGRGDLIAAGALVLEGTGPLSAELLLTDTVLDAPHLVRGYDFPQRHPPRLLLLPLPHLHFVPLARLPQQLGGQLAPGVAPHPLSLYRALPGDILRLRIAPGRLSSLALPFMVLLTELALHPLSHHLPLSVARLPPSVTQGRGHRLRHTAEVRETPAVRRAHVLRPRRPAGARAADGGDGHRVAFGRGECRGCGGWGPDRQVGRVGSHCGEGHVRSVRSHLVQRPVRPTVRNLQRTGHFCLGLDGCGPHVLLFILDGGWAGRGGRPAAGRGGRCRPGYTPAARPFH
eukprot:Hpha_TRINITY_DN2891_c0_g1::TRINITY_DN2891_c0_g1_i1::g.171413::m.171413